jgi:hypothetical protein
MKRREFSGLPLAPRQDEAWIGSNEYFDSGRNGFGTATYASGHAQARDERLCCVDRLSRQLSTAVIRCPLSANRRHEQVQQKSLLDHLVGAGEHGGRHDEAERLGGLEID